MRLPWRALLLVMTLPGVLPCAAHAQEALDGRALRDELARVRDAAIQEASGDYAGAEARLRGVLEVNPASLSALLILERVYRVQGKLDSLLPYVERLVERDARSALAHQVLLRTYAGLDRTQDLERAAQAWIRLQPELETPYREIARIWHARGDAQRALAVLEGGRKRLGTAGALALELGDVYVALGDLDRAVLEWDRAIGAEGQGFMLVQRRLRALPDGGAAVVPRLIATLRRSEHSLPRRRAALQLALDAGRGAEAEAIARPLLDAMPAKSREVFLADVARRADGADLAGIAYWAYGALLERAEGDTVRLLALRTRLAQLALQLGDTARAAAVYDELERASAAGSPQRRQAVAVRIRLDARDGTLDDASQRLAAFRSEFPEAPELDETAATVSDALLLGGRLDEAERAVLGVHGPRSGLARGRAFLRRGDVARATAEFLSAAPALRGIEATRTIALAAALTRMTPAAGELVSAAAAAAADDPATAALDLVERSAQLPGRERAAVLEFAASIADDAALPRVAEQVRRELLAEHPDSDAAAAALLWLARDAAGRGDPDGEARVLLEKLILEYPRSALVPEARRELDRSAREERGRKAGES